MLFVVCRLLLVNCSMLRVVACCVLLVRGSLFVVRCPLLVVNNSCSSVVARCSLLVVSRSLCAACCL